VKAADRECSLSRAHAYSADSIATLDQLRRKSKNDVVRFHAAVALLDRGYGKPTNYIEAGSSIADEIDKIKRRGVAWVEASQAIAVGSHSREMKKRPANGRTKRDFHVATSIHGSRDGDRCARASARCLNQRCDVGARHHFINAPTTARRMA
jgi:hypothetical protein